MSTEQLHMILDSVGLLALTVVIGISLIFFIFYYLRRNSKLRDEIDALKKQTEYGHKLFDEHFKITDQTIVDLRADKASLIKQNQKLMEELESAMAKLAKLSKASKL
ncbi:MAG: hypothetical protein M1484_04505 [Patescibacteria group bacterium]|nr:hypothetical protein [Patescibacteria group bacterium]MCL5432320.1 hypothetical protein [Patescibacteria group bacterium]